ncbi:MAG: hypothetical protein MI861_24215, partial [Pirellulales bacterium]|nr:hypothetical protein [Pirellulales bacterium]
MLIFLMISSLANFLMLILYHGGNPQRVAWTMLMFTMGAVCIARIAIEQDRVYSLGYAGALGLITFLVMIQFVGSPLFCAFILIMIGYLADRIVHDCTLIDDSVDASGQGLIDSGRLFVKAQLEPRTDGEQDVPVKTTRGNRRNQPGRTVMFLALGALPLFGLGQFFLREDTQTWHRALFLLAIYLFSSLSLLVTTSFLGLRRYLRQRQADMPADVSIAWLVGGGAMIAAILLIAYLAPLPGQMLASIELPNFLDSPDDLSASRFGWGDEAASQSNPDAATTQNDPQQENKEVHSTSPQEGAPPGDAGDGNRDDGPAGQRQGNQNASQSGGSDQGDSKGQSQSQSQGDQQQSQSSRSGDSSDQQNSRSDQGDRRGGSEQNSDSSSSESSQASESEDSQSQAAESQAAESQTGQNQNSNSTQDESGSRQNSSSGASNPLSNA